MTAIHTIATNEKFASVVCIQTSRRQIHPPLLKKNVSSCKYVTSLTNHFTIHEKGNIYCE